MGAHETQKNKTASSVSPHLRSVFSSVNFTFSDVASSIVRMGLLAYGITASSRATLNKTVQDGGDDPLPISNLPPTLKTRG